MGGFVSILVLGLLALYGMSRVKGISGSDADKTNLETLQLVQILYRHGDRTPTKFYPTDPYEDVLRYWPQGIGQLTDVGKIQHYELGKYFRQRYDGFLSRTYIPHEIYILASEMDRTIMSAEVNLAGLYEPTDSDKNWNPTIPWTPVPVRTIPQKEDKLLRTTKPCPRFNRLYEELMESDFVRQMNAENKEFIDMVLKNTGISGNSLEDIVGVEDVLLVEKIHNFTLPQWTKNIMEKFHALAAKHFALSTHTKEMKKLKGGPLWKLFLENMHNFEVKLWRQGAKPKFHVYSAHDSTLIRLLNTLGIYNEIMPTYAAAFIVELHKDKDYPHDYFVKMFYRNETWSAPYVRIVPGCPEPCSLANLTKVTADIVPADWESECQEEIWVKDPPKDKVESVAEGQTILTQTFLIVASLFIILSILIFISRKKINLDLFTYRMPLPSRSNPRSYRSINQYDAI